MTNSKKEYEDYNAVTTAISRVVAPVVICMIFSVCLVNSTGPGCPSKKVAATWTPLPAFKPTKKPQPQQPAKGEKLKFNKNAAIIFICVFCVLIVAFTYLIVFLFKKGHTRFIAAWLFVAVFLIFAYVGGVYLFEFARSQCINMDWITLSFVVWNFTVTGIVAVFGNVPRFINQIYLIVMSALMAYVFRTLPEWTTWTLLGVLVVWDLFAVLTPYGPLRALVEHAKEKNEPLPALIYDTDPRDIGRDPETTPAVVFNSKKRNKRRTAENGDDTNETGSGDDDAAARRRRRRLRRRKREEETEAVIEEANEEAKATNAIDSHHNAEAEAQMAVTGDAEPTMKEEEPQQDEDRKVTNTNESKPGEEKTKEATAIGTLGTHLKLGLGDFVFYSILVGVASKSGAMTTIMSFVAILAGLCLTLFLVLVYRKALPALPISIVFGIVFYFLTVFTVEPMVQNSFVQLAYY